MVEINSSLLYYGSLAAISTLAIAASFNILRPDKHDDKSTNVEQPIYTNSQPTTPMARVQYEISATPYLPIPMISKTNTNGLETTLGEQE